MDIRQRKQILRKCITEQKNAYSRETLDELSSQAMVRLEKCDFFKKAHCIALYHAIPGEVQTHTFIEKWKEKKRILLPVIIGDTLKLKVYAGIESLTAGSFGILEPDRNAPGVHPREVELIVIPGLAFDRKGNRMGRGKGYYDRMLTEITATKIGLCFDFQLVDEVPTESFDQTMDVIVTDHELILPK